MIVLLQILAWAALILICGGTSYLLAMGIATCLSDNRDNNLL